MEKTVTSKSKVKKQSEIFERKARISLISSMAVFFVAGAFLTKVGFGAVEIKHPMQIYILAGILAAVAGELLYAGMKHVARAVQAEMKENE